MAGLEVPAEVLRLLADAPPQRRAERLVGRRAAFDCRPKKHMHQTPSRNDVGYGLPTDAVPPRGWRAIQSSATSRAQLERQRRQENS